MQPNEKLEKELIDIFFHKNGWQENIDYDLDNMSSLNFEVIPEDAKSIDEVKEFSAVVDVMGTQTYIFTREEK